ncbi:conserved hypothetical protein [Chelatococcus asaccharovorans]|nr:conserved hypothetical protein [Chelatococcus asaccharovorans]CAH1684647.1 conserved hypothetical protein [Chelatococcus asaccharovorans]
MSMIRVEFPNLTCGLAVAIERVPNVTFTPLGIPRCCRCKGALSLSISILPNSKTNSRKTNSCKTNSCKTRPCKTRSRKTDSGNTALPERLSTQQFPRLDPSVASL